MRSKRKVPIPPLSAVLLALLAATFADCMVRPTSGERPTGETSGPFRMAIRLTRTDDFIAPSPAALGGQHRIEGLWPVADPGRKITLQAATWSDVGDTMRVRGWRKWFTTLARHSLVTFTSARPFNFGREFAFRIPHCAPRTVNGKPQYTQGSAQIICDDRLRFWRRFGWDDALREDFVSGATGFYPNCNEENLQGGWPYAGCPRYVARIQAVATDLEIVEGLPLRVPWYIVVYADQLAPETSGSGYAVTPAAEPPPPPAPPPPNNCTAQACCTTPDGMPHGFQGGPFNDDPTAFGCGDLTVDLPGCTFPCGATRDVHVCCLPSSCAQFFGPDLPPECLQ